MGIEQQAGLRVRPVKGLNAFQWMIYRLSRELRARGYDSDGATKDRVLRIISTVPSVRRVADAAGYEVHIPEEEANRITAVLIENMVFQERPVFVFNDLMDIQVSACDHGKVLACAECRRTRGRHRPDGGIY